MKNTNIVVNSPESFKCYKYLHHFSIFLGGSIAGGDWRTDFSKTLEGGNILILDPTILDWNFNIKTDYSDLQFKQHADWELSAMENCDLIVFYLKAGTMSPIPLLEIGLHTKSKRIVIFCEDGFINRGYLDAICKMYDVPQVNSFEELSNYIKASYNRWTKCPA
jgi:hypothetical protein